MVAGVAHVASAGGGAPAFCGDDVQAEEVCQDAGGQVLGEGSANDYDYVDQDPVNDFDLAGTFNWRRFGGAVRAHRGAILTGLAFVGCLMTGWVACAGVTALAYIVRAQQRAEAEGRLAGDVASECPGRHLHQCYIRPCESVRRRALRAPNPLAADNWSAGDVEWHESGTAAGRSRCECGAGSCKYGWKLLLLPQAL